MRVHAFHKNLVLLKYHVPYWESDHVLNIAYNVLTGGTCMEDIDRLRNDETYMNALDAERIPDPTTAGDFLRRFDETGICALQETINGTRAKVWALQDASFRKEAIIDVDGSIAETTGECKEGMDISYNGIWGYAPLIVTLANTNEVRYLVNRPGLFASSPSGFRNGFAIGSELNYPGNHYRKQLPAAIIQHFGPINLLHCLFVIHRLHPDDEAKILTFQQNNLNNPAIYSLICLWLFLRHLLIGITSKPGAEGSVVSFAKECPYEYIRWNQESDAFGYPMGESSSKCPF
jgi:hypothetical protein